MMRWCRLPAADKKLLDPERFAAERVRERAAENRYRSKPEARQKHNAAGCAQRRAHPEKVLANNRRKAARTQFCQAFTLELLGKEELDKRVAAFMAEKEKING